MAWKVSITLDGRNVNGLSRTDVDILRFSDQGVLSRRGYAMYMAGNSGKGGTEASRRRTPRRATYRRALHAGEFTLRQLIHGLAVAHGAWSACAGARGAARCLLDKTDPSATTSSGARTGRRKRPARPRCALNAAVSASLSRP